MVGCAGCIASQNEYAILMCMYRGFTETLPFFSAQSIFSKPCIVLPLED